MPIITVSLDEEMLALLHRLRDELGLKGRSDTVRTALRSLSAEHDEMDAGEGLTEGVLIVIHREAVSAELDRARHLHHDVVKTQLHNHLQGGRCLQIFIISGDADNIHGLLHSIRRLGGVDYTRFIPSNRP